MSSDKKLFVLKGTIKTPPFSVNARIEAGYLIRKLQQGENLSLPESRPMPIIGKRCHELRIKDGDLTWRIIYRTDEDAIIIAEIFAKKTQRTPKRIIDNCRARLGNYDDS